MRRLRDLRVPSKQAYRGLLLSIGNADRLLMRPRRMHAIYVSRDERAGLSARGNETNFSCDFLVAVVVDKEE